MKKLHDWRKCIYAHDHVFAHYNHTSILDDDLITTLISHGRLSVEQANDLIQDKWPFHKHHASELRAYVTQLPIKFITKSRKCAASPSPDSQNLGEELGVK